MSSAGPEAEPEPQTGGPRPAVPLVRHRLLAPLQPDRSQEVLLQRHEVSRGRRREDQQLELLSL